MLRSALIIALAVTATGVATVTAGADCESDMLQLEKALDTPNLSAEAKAALDNASKASVAAMKKDDDAACHKVIADALPKAGMALR